jgi:type VI secretion system secreted protein VgrG
MDIRAGIIAAAILLGLGALIIVRNGLFTLRSARKLTFYRLRQSRISSAWRLFGLALILVVIAIILPIYVTPIAFKYFPPSPTVVPTLTPSVVPTITLSPTITLTPTITDTPLYSETPTITPTPFIPIAIEAGFVSIVTPNPDAVVTVLQFSTSVDANGYCQSPLPMFRNPLNKIYACYQYDKMTIGTQWTALWYRGDQLLPCSLSESYPWNLSTGGIAYSECALSSDQWLPGVYIVQIFVGHDFKRAGSFTVEGEAPTAAPTPIPSATLSPTPALTTTP